MQKFPLSTFFPLGVERGKGGVKASLLSNEKCNSFYCYIQFLCIQEVSYIGLLTNTIHTLNQLKIYSFFFSMHKYKSIGGVPALQNL